MKRKILISIIINFLLVLLINIKPIKAAVIESVDYKDDFNKSEVSDSFIKNELVKINVDHYAIRFTPSSYSWTSHLLYSGYKIEKDCMVEFEIEPVNKDGFWFAMSFGAQNASLNFALTGGAILFNNEKTTQLFLNDGASLQTDNVFYNLNPFDYRKSKVQVEFTKLDKDLYDINYKVYDLQSNTLKGEELFSNIECKDGYIGFNSNKYSCDIMNFKIYENGEVVVNDDFSNSSILYPQSGNPDSKWETIEFNEGDVQLGPIAELDMTSVSSRAIYSKPFKRELSDSQSILYRLDFDLNLQKMDLYASTGILLGLENENSDGSFIGFKKNVIGYSIESNGESIDTTDTPLKSILGVTVEVYFDKTVKVTTSTNLVFTTLINSVEGYFGFETRGDEGDKGACIDNFKYTKMIFKDRSTPDKAINFNGTKTTVVEGEDTYYEYYISSKEWYKGPSVNLAYFRTQDNGNGYVTFSQSQYNSAFGPKEKFKDFICTFDITIIKKPDNGEWFGLEFGKQTYDMNAQNTKSLGFSYYDGNTAIQATNAKLMNGQTYDSYLNRDGEVENLFLENAKYTLMYIAKDSTIRMYIKKDTDSDFALSFEVARIENIDTDGYLAVYGYNGVSFRLDNFAVRNLDFEVPSSLSPLSDYLETFRLDFSDTKVVSYFDLEDANLENKELLINEGGQITTKSLVSGNILRFDILDINEGLTIKHGLLEISIYKDELVVKSNGNTERVQIKDTNLIGSTFEIEEIGEMLTISFKEKNKPISAIYDNKYKFNIYRNAEYDYMSISGIDGVLGLSKISIFNLDSNVTINNRNFDPETDVSNIWFERPSINDINTEKKGCKSFISSMSLVSLLLPLSISFIIKRKEND